MDVCFLTQETKVNIVTNEISVKIVSSLVKGLLVSVSRIKAFDIHLVPNPYILHVSYFLKQFIHRGENKVPD
jgi:hypothetical protein